MQETHADKNIIQTKIIAQEIGLPYSINDIYDNSHISRDQGLGQAVISRLPIIEHNFDFFHNPHLETIGPNGSKWISHNKGVSKCLLKLENGKLLQVGTLHLIPFRKFEINPLEEKFINLRNNISKLSSPSCNSFLLQGDFNFDNPSLKSLLPTLFEEEVFEVTQNDPTTPKNRKYDHILYKGLRHINSVVVSDVLTDHFPILSEFDIF